MKKLVALFFTALYASFFAGTVMYSGDFTAFSFEKNITQAGHIQMLSDDDKNGDRTSFSPHISKAVKHSTNAGKTKWPRVKSNFLTTTHLFVGKKHDASKQFALYLTSASVAAPLYIKNRVLLI